MARRNFRPRSAGTSGRPELVSNCCVLRSKEYSREQAGQASRCSRRARISVPVTAPSRYGENNSAAFSQLNIELVDPDVFVPDFMDPDFAAMYFMASPQPFYPLQQPVAADRRDLLLQAG